MDTDLNNHESDNDCTTVKPPATGSHSYENPNRMHTIGSMREEALNSNKRALNDTNDSNQSPAFQQPFKAYKPTLIDPILILSGIDVFNRSDYIEFDSEISEKTGAEIKFTKLDKNGNLLIFPRSSEGADLILNCKDLFPGLKKIDLNNKDTRPKIVIFGLTHQLALKYKSNLTQEGIVELINLTKMGAPQANIVKAVFEDVEKANSVIKQGFIQIKYNKFKVEKDYPRSKPENKIKQRVANYENSYNNQMNAANENEIAESRTMNKHINGNSTTELSALFSELHSRLDSDKIDSKNNLTIELNKNKLELESALNEKMIKNNNCLISAFVDIINATFTTKIDKTKAKNQINSKCNKVLADENDSLKIALDKLNVLSSSDQFVFNQDEI